MWNRFGAEMIIHNILIMFAFINSAQPANIQLYKSQQIHKNTFIFSYNELPRAPSKVDQWNYLIKNRRVIVRYFVQCMRPLHSFYEVRYVTTYA